MDSTIWFLPWSYAVNDGSCQLSKPQRSIPVMLGATKPKVWTHEKHEIVFSGDFLPLPQIRLSGVKVLTEFSIFKKSYHWGRIGSSRKFPIPWSNWGSSNLSNSENKGGDRITISLPTWAIVGHLYCVTKVCHDPQPSPFYILIKVADGFLTFPCLY